MGKRFLSLLMVLCLSLSLVMPVVAAPEETNPDDSSTTTTGTAVYVSENGSDENGDGSEGKPYATLAKAVEKAVSGDTIYVMSDLAANSLALVNKKNITIDGNGHTITRDDDFSSKNDQGRGGYNPAMIEVANGSTLTLQNITLDDNFLHEGEKFDLASGTSGNEQKVHDGIIASYGDGKSTIILGEGATLKNFGGLAAVYITGEGGDGAKLIMKSGSKICDDNSSSRQGGYAAIFNHGGTVEAETGSSIENIDGRAIYADNAGVTTFAGSIKEITSSEAVKSAGDAGVAYYGSGRTVFTLASGGSIEAIHSHDSSGADSVLHLISCTFKTEQGSEIRNIEVVGIADMNGATVDLAGSISGCNANDVLFRMRGTQGTFILQETGIIKNCNTSDVGIVYLNEGKPTIEIAGTIDTVNKPAFYLSNNGGDIKDGTITLTETGKITNVTGYGIRAEKSALTTIAGMITNCSSYAVQYYPKGNQSLLTIKSTATIENNNGGKAQIRAQNTLLAMDAQEHIVVEPGGLDGNKTIDLTAFDVTLDENYAAVKLGNAGSAAATALKTAITTAYSDWKPVGSSAVWIQPSESEIHFTVPHTSSMKKTALFAALIPLNADGTPVQDANDELILQAVKNTDPVDVTLTGLTANQSYALMFVNNNEYTLAPDDITIYTGGGQGSEDATQNKGFPALTIANSVDEIKSLTIDDQEVADDDLMAALLDRLEVTYSDQNGNPVENDAEAGEYIATLSWKDGQKPTSIRINGNEVADDFGTGTLIVRYVENIDDAVSGDSTHKLLTEEPTAPVENAEAIAKKGGFFGTTAPKFYTNDNEDFKIDDTRGISILDDALLTDEDGTDRQALLEEKAEKSGQLTPLGDGQAYRYEFHYLDLVDAHNGNAWVSASYGTTVYLPYPDGVTADTAESMGVQVIHYKDLHREYGIAGQAEVEEAIAACELETMNVTFDTNGIKFDVDREGFSPFAVVWQTQAKDFTITATANGGGTISPSGTITVTEGEDQTFAISASDGYKIADVKVDGTSVGAVDSYTFEDVKANHSIEATFTKEGGIVPPITYYTITASAGEGGAINPSGTIRVPAGGDRTFTISAAEGYEIADVLVDGQSVGAVDSYTFENVRANHTISVVFQEASGIADPDDTGVSDWLDTDNHKVYLNGYPDDSFQPEKDMTRAEAAQMFYNLLRDQDVETTGSFTDVAADAWYATAVNALASLEIVNGVGDDRFSPERTITRAEFTTMAMRFCDEIPDGENIFSDVDQEDWFYEYVVGSIQYGWINGYPDGTFRPNDTISRAEVTTITNRMLGRAADEAFVDQHQDSLRIFTDLKDTHWAYYQIVEATNAHEYTKDNGTEDWTKLI